MDKEPKIKTVGDALDLAAQDLREASAIIEHQAKEIRFWMALSGALLITLAGVLVFG